MDIDVERIRIASRLRNIQQIYGYNKKVAMLKLDSLIDELVRLSNP